MKQETERRVKQTNRNRGEKRASATQATEDVLLLLRTIVPNLHEPFKVDALYVLYCYPIYPGRQSTPFGICGRRGRLTRGYTGGWLAQESSFSYFVLVLHLPLRRLPSFYREKGRALVFSRRP